MESNALQVAVSDTVDVVSSAPPTVVRHRKRGHPRRNALALLVILAAVAATGWELVNAHSARGPVEATVSVTSTPGGPQVTLTNGSLDRDQLRSALQKSGHGSYFVPAADGGFELTADLVVGKNAHLTIDKTALLLLSNASEHVRITAAAGWVSFSRDTIASWDNGTVDTDLTDGRADVVADGAGSRLDFANSTISFLGANANDPGVSWRDSAVGAVVSSSFTNDFRGAYAYKSGRITVVGSTFATNAETGLLMLSPGADSTVKASVFDGNTSNGLEIDLATAPYVDQVEASNNSGAGIVIDNGSGARIAKSELHNNKQQGITLTGPTGAQITTSKIWSNATGVTISGGDAVIESTFLSGNINDGVYLTGPATKLALTDDRLDHNDRSGIYLADGHGTISGSLIDTNGSGIYVAAPDAWLVATGNNVEGSVKDGIALTGIAHDTVTGNTVSKSGNAAFSVATKTNLTAMTKANTILKSKGETVSRVRAS